MSKVCAHCRENFSIDSEDLKFYERVSPVVGGKKFAIPAPTLCPQCRQERRMRWRNELQLYHRKCDLTGKQIISIYAPEKPYTVYNQEDWWGDRWNGLEYGREFDFQRPFFDQFAELQRTVPRLALYQKNVENSAYTNHTEKLKNSYLTVDAANSEGIYYSKWIVGGCRDLADCYQLEGAELCIESLYGVGDYHCAYLFLADRCRDSFFLYDCVECRDCLMCWNLRQKQYCILNTQYSKEEYTRLLKAAQLENVIFLAKAKTEFLEMLKKKAIHQYQRLLYSEDCSGDFVYHCKQVNDSYDVIESRDCRYCYDSGYLQDCYDTYEAAFNCALQYETHGCNRSSRTLFSTVSYDVSDALYTDSCHNSKNLFGCIGLKRQEYCILNRRYSKEEYAQLVPKIIAHMQRTKEWGEFFPEKISPFAYNESVAQEYIPRTAEAVKARGWPWRPEEKTAEYLGPIAVLPETITATTDHICEQILLCAQTHKPYKIIPQELQLYRTLGLPLPRLSPEVRRQERLKLRTPRQLWERGCSNCRQVLRSSYAPDRPEIVYCEKCYLETVS